MNNKDLITRLRQDLQDYKEYIKYIRYTKRGITIKFDNDKSALIKISYKNRTELENNYDYEIKKIKYDIYSYIK